MIDRISSAAADARQCSLIKNVKAHFERHNHPWLYVLCCAVGVNGLIN